MNFVYYRELQAFLSAHFLRHGATLTFGQAIQAMAERGLVREGAPEAVDFSLCDISDPREIARFIDRIQIPYTAEVTELESSTTLTVPLIVFKYPAHSRAGQHTQDGLELNYVCSGSCTLSFEGKEYTVHENEVVIIPPLTAHDVYDTENAIVLSFLIHQDIFNETFFQVLKTNTPLAAFYNSCLHQRSDIFPRFKVDDPARFARVFLALYSEFSSTRDYRYEICVNYIRILFAFLLRQLNVRFEPHALDINGSPLNDMPQILNYIKENYRTLSLDALAASFHYNRSYLGKQIKKYTQQTFSELVTNYRLETALSLLLYSEHSIATVAEESGYQSADHFSRTFKKRYGVSPSQYKRARRADAGSEQYGAIRLPGLLRLTI